MLEGGRGYVTAYTGVRLLDVPTVADRSQGDIHIFGNPHLHTDPLRVVQIARNITTGLKRVAPDRSVAWDLPDPAPTPPPTARRRSPPSFSRCASSRASPTS